MMRSMLLSDIAKLCGGQLIGADREIQHVTTDSRQASAGSLFIALIGERFDGHDFVAEVASQGASAAVVSKRLPEGLPQILVENTLKALGSIGRFNRERYSNPVVAITGSGGKTSVKEMLAQMLRVYLEDAEAVLATKGNLNNDIGAPLTLLELNPEHRFAVIELGASAMGEIAYTTALTKPQVAILNNALPAHVEGFGSLRHIVQAKSEIYQGLTEQGIGIVNIDDPNADYWLNHLKLLDRQIITFGTNPSADLVANNLRVNSRGCYSFEIKTQTELQEVHLSVLGRHMVLNALAAVSAWVALGLPLSAAVSGMESYKGFQRRLEVTKLRDGLILIDDSYNANPASMRAAIDVVSSLDGPRALVLGDMAELGEFEIQEHKDLGEEVAKAGIDLLFTCGNLSAHISETAAKSGVKCHHFNKLEALVDHFDAERIDASVLLCKGSRSAGIDRLVDSLKEAGH